MTTENHHSNLPLAREVEPSPSVTRRDFLTLAWKGLLGLSGLLGLGGLWRYLSYRPDPSPPTTFDLGAPAGFALNTRTTIPDALAVVQHTNDGLHAISLVCPHLGCIVDLTDEGFECPCHGSRFALDGSLLYGPAGQALRPLRLEITPDDALILNTEA